MLDYLKSFQEWFKLKVLLWEKPSPVVFKQGDVWWCSLGVNLGEEVFGKGLKFTRPVLVFRKFTSNSFLGLPLTTQKKIGTWYAEMTLHNTKRCVMFNQARVLDRKRLTSRIGTLDESELKRLRDKFLEFYSS